MSAGGLACSERTPALALLVGGDLEPGAAAELRVHLGGCAGCARHLRELEAARTWFCSGGGPAFSSELFQALGRGIEAGLEEREEQAAIRLSWGRILRDRIGGWRFAAGFRPWWPGLLGGTLACLVALFAAVGSERGAARPGQVSEGQVRGERTVGLDGARAEGLDGALAAESGDKDTTAPLRIELATRDPNIRIIWFAAADSGGPGPGPGGL